MAREDLNNEPEEEMLDEEMQGEGEEGESKLAGAPAWVISITIHVVVLFIAWCIVFVTGALQEDPPAVRITTIEPPPKKEEPPKMDREVKPNELTLNVETEADKPSPINQLDVPIEEVTSREEDTDSETPKGREEAVADSEMGGTGAFMAIGAGGGSSGMFGSRTGGGKKRAIGKFGGSKGGESAVDAALRWFKKHQSPNGQWSVSGYPNNCTENPKCEAGTEHADEEGDVASTGYALLCFLGAGYDHRMPSKYKQTVKKGIDWMVSVQKADGLWGNRNYEHAVATMAIAEAYAMSNDPALKAPGQKGVDIVLARQTKDKTGGYGLGWDYVAPNPTRNDSSVSGWNVMALKSAAAAGLSIGNGMEGAKQWLEKAWKATNKDWDKLDPYKESAFPYTWDSEGGGVDVGAPGAGHHELACVGALCSVFLGHKAGDVMLETLCNYVMKYQMPKGYPCNTYYMYYNTLAIFQAGGDRWTKWNGSVRDLLVGAQRKGEGCFDGSWDFKDTVFHGHDIGRLVSTAYCTLSLEVYYRYLPVAAKH